jgi:drug/metabolite transporter (DMT)-like permease
MTPQPEIVALVLLAALSHALWNTLIKTGEDRLMTMAMILGTGTLICAPLAFAVAPPDAASWPYLLTSALLLHTFYFAFLVKSYQVGDLSHVYPLARGVSPLLVAALAAAAAEEILPLMGLAGVALACLGITSLAFETGRPWRNDSRPLFYALGTAIFITLYTVVDGLGVRLSGNPFSYIVWLMMLHSIPFTCIAIVRRRGNVAPILRACWKKCLAGSLLNLFGYGVVLWAMNASTMAAISALRETSVIFAALIGALMLGERFGRLRIFAAVLVAAGIAMMNLA